MAVTALDESPIQLVSSQTFPTQTPIHQTPTASPMKAWDPAADLLNFRENEQIFREGDEVKGLYLLKSGTVKITTQRTLTRGRVASPEFITKIVGAGEFFGFRPLMGSGLQKDAAKALKASEVLVYPKEAVTAILSGPETLLKRVLLQMNREIEATEANEQLHYLASVQERIAHQLLILGERFGVTTEQGTSINLRLTRNELAQLAGTINESLSRHLTELKAEGILELHGKEIIIKDRAALMTRSGNFV